jgi:hypothetical protein
MKLKAFLSIPYGNHGQQKLFWNVLTASIRKTAESIKSHSLEIQRADDAIVAFQVKENVRRQIDQCDFTIAVVTDNNPNVFWEIGYSESQNKPVVYLVDEENSARISESPILIIEALKCAYRGSSLADFVENKQELPGELGKKLEMFLVQAIDSVIAATKRHLLMTSSSREGCKLPEMIANAKQRICLITTNLKYFVSFDKFTVEAEGKEPVFAFDPPIKKGVDVRILALDPESPIVRYRAEQLRMDHDIMGYREELRDSARRFHQKFKDNGNFSLRLYDDLPLQITIIVDSAVVTSMIKRGQRSRETLHFALDMNTPGTRTTFE